MTINIEKFTRERVALVQRHGRLAAELEAIEKALGPWAPVRPTGTDHQHAVDRAMHTERKLRRAKNGRRRSKVSIAGRISNFLHKHPNTTRAAIIESIGHASRVDNALAYLLKSKKVTRRGKRGAYKYRLA
jgi:hypothetical protein